jgi:hypothetical protein
MREQPASGIVVPANGNRRLTVSIISCMEMDTGEVAPAIFENAPSLTLHQASVECARGPASLSQSTH